MDWNGNVDGDEPDLSASERKALGDVWIVVELPRALQAQLWRAEPNRPAPNRLEDLVRRLVGSVYVANQAMSALLAEVIAGGFERHAHTGREDGEARAEALADLEYSNLIAGGLYLSAARMLRETGGA